MVFINQLKTEGNHPVEYNMVSIVMGVPPSVNGWLGGTPLFQEPSIYIYLYIYIESGIIVDCGYDYMILYDYRNGYYVKWEDPESNAMRGRFLRIALVWWLFKMGWSCWWFVFQGDDLYWGLDTDPTLSKTIRHNPNLYICLFVSKNKSWEDFWAQDSTGIVVIQVV